MRLTKSKDIVLCVVIGLMWATQPVIIQKFRGKLLTSLGKISFFLARSRASRADRNLAKSMGDTVSAAARRQIVVESFIEYWREIFSLLHSCDKHTRLNVGIEGIEYLTEAQRKGKGTILWQPSDFGRRNFVNQYLSAHGFSLIQVHAGTHIVGYPTHISNLITKPFFEWCSRKFLKEIIYLPDSGSIAFTRVLVNRLQSNAVVSIAGDAMGSRKDVPVKFFDDVSYFPIGIFSLSKVSGAPILPVFSFVEESGLIRLIIEPPLMPTSYAHGDMLNGPVAECVGKLEHYIRKYPGQYTNWQQMYRLPHD